MEKNKAEFINGKDWKKPFTPNMNRRCFTHDYNGIGTYLVTCVTTDRQLLFGYVDGDLRARLGDDGFAHIVPTPLAQKIIEEELPKIHQHYPMVTLWRFVLMPDHFHLLLHVSSPLPEGKKLGDVIGAFKAGCTRAWSALRSSAQPDAPLTGTDQRTARPDASLTGTDQRTADIVDAGPAGGDTAVRSGVSGVSREVSSSLFEPGFNDRFITSSDQLNRWKAYIEENPLRLLIRQRFPDIMKRALCITLNGTRYSAYGNFMLLKIPEKHQVMCHRKAYVSHLNEEECQRYGYTFSPDSHIKTLVPYELTEAFTKEKSQLLYAASTGIPLVTPGISHGEQILKRACIENGFPLIHLQQEPITKYWKPERQRFYACARGKLLILAPWAEDLQGDSDYDRFHNLNELAARICALTDFNSSFRWQ